MFCQHATAVAKNINKCALNFYGGTPSTSVCEACIVNNQNKPGLGDIIERLAKPIAVALRLPCLDENKNLRPESPCAKRRDALNKLTK